MEYIFEDYDTMEEHMSKMTIPANGVKKFGTAIEIRSAIITAKEFESVPECE